MLFRFALRTLVLWLGLLAPALGQVIPPPMKTAAPPPQLAAPNQSVAAKKDSVRNEGLTSETNALRRIDSLRRANTGRLEQIQGELLTLKSNSADKRRERELVTELNALHEADSLRKAHARHYIDSLKLHVKGFPVAPHDDTLFYVYTKLGPFSPAERAALTSEKIQQLERSVFFRPDSLMLYPSEQTVDLMYGEKVCKASAATTRCG